MKTRIGCAAVLLWLSAAAGAYGQETKSERFGNGAISLGLGVGFDDGPGLSGDGVVYGFGYRHSIPKINRLRLETALLMGSFSTRHVTDVPDRFYHTNQLMLNSHLDVIRFHGLALVITIGGFVSYKHGLTGTGGWPGTTRSSYFRELNGGVTFSGALRINPRNSPVAVELRPINLYAANNGYVLGTAMVNLDIKLHK